MKTANFYLTDTAAETNFPAATALPHNLSRARQARTVEARLLISLATQPDSQSQPRSYSSAHALHGKSIEDCPLVVTGQTCDF